MPSARLHQIRIDFSVTPEVKRFVYAYLIEAKGLYLVDAGVAGSETQILGHVQEIGRSPSELRGIFLTHAHPDHIGTAAWFRERFGCSVYASAGEKPWIEDIDRQFRERPIPNFYGLAGRSCPVDVCLADGDCIAPEPELELIAIATPGHSPGHMAYRTGQALFIGDAVPVKGDIPIFTDEQATRKTLARLARLMREDGIATCYPAWDRTYDACAMQAKLQEAEAVMGQLKEAVLQLDEGSGLPLPVGRVCARLGMPALAANPLFARTVDCLRKRP
ncbi:MAG: MBL fold metallo-hydrolase [Desulfovibrio sp.]|nr:MBL fold metallo-hydrolase [Desulfovibrio sp.]